MGRGINGEGMTGGGRGRMAENATGALRPTDFSPTPYCIDSEEDHQISL